MEFNLTTPSLLFPAISLLLLGFTNRFSIVASLIRELYSQFQKDPDPKIIEQIKNLRLRLIIIRIMQALGVLSILLCVLCMFLLFKNFIEIAKYIFGISLILLMTSLALSIWEIQISNNALKVILKDLEDKCKRNKLC
ncbi:MAG TPA: DUF2721 domain-containing protein [Spirochaetota bacterium]|nr:DUF2721 domain-containing protein [Spirochaetota bacterium]HOL56899.1 DUF2721 domain-containing protein [Spirochaetota bacterium]HPP04309.1 DUF2721 domain-containing protein [Spirochaetota bacterium]